jgi:hypothetical protein
MTAARPAGEPGLPVIQDACCPAGSACGAEPPVPAARDAGWIRAARQARWLAWASLAWMCTEGAIGLWQGIAAGRSR